MAVIDVDETTFQQQVIERSREVPVVVDFWAAWCGPCRQLGPALEKAATEREGRVDLAKLDVDTNQQLAAQYRVQGIPAVKAFRDGKVAEEFTGAIPPRQVEDFFDRLVPSEAALAAEEAIRSGNEASLRAAVEADPRNIQAATKLAQILMARGEYDGAVAILDALPQDFQAEGLAARAWLAGHDAGLDEAFRAWDDGDHATALERLQEGFAAASDDETRDRIRKVMVAIFTELGSDSDLARQHRRRLATALY
jgi:putative thioredoxin